jgi:hypothetical protein
MNNNIIRMLITSSLVAIAPAVAQAQTNKQPQSINQRQVDLNARINAGLADRSLTATEAAKLRTDYQGIARLEQQYRVSGRTLTRAERTDLNRRLDQLASRIETNRADNDRTGQSINQRQANLYARIDAGVQDRSLTTAEANQLRAEYQDIDRLETQYRVSGRTVTQAERADLDRRFDQLSSRIQANRNDNDRAGQGINQRQANLYARIDAGVHDRSLTTAEANQLRAEYQDIDRLETQYRVSGRTVTQAERANLDRRFDRLSSRIQYSRNDDDSRWTNLDRRQAQFNERLNRAVSDRRVSAREASELRSEFNGIASLERRYRLSRPGITVAERNDLNTRFNRLEINYRQSINSSSYSDGSRQYQSLFDFLFGI